MKLFFRVCVFSVAALVAVNASADIAVVTHPDNSADLSKDDISRIFLGKVKTFPGGEPVTPYNLPEGETARAEFDQNVIGRSSSQMKAYWSKLVFTGKGTPPEEAANSAEVKAKVSASPTALGYIDASEVDDSVRVIGTF